MQNLFLIVILACSEKSQNSTNRDFSLILFAQNDKKSMDCHDSASQNLAMTESNVDSANCVKIAESTQI
ncbi:hypothetical protein [Helicobacter sp. 23-1045]